MQLKNLDDTQFFARRLAGLLSVPFTIGLVGELGAGKTTFTKALVAEMQSLDQVSSPTFVLCHEYETSTGTIIEHWDLYRLNSLPEELEEPPGENTVRVVEWVNKFPKFRETLDLSITLVVNEDLTREVVIEGQAAELFCRRLGN
jgi:tRNA threonylcarbamoyladenosine biosynthesis protein TsaE